MTSHPASMTAEKGSGGLFRSLLLPLLLLVLAVGVMGTLWTGWIRISEERARLRETLQGNANMLERMNLPMSGRMADNLSTAMGRPVVLVLADGSIEGGQSWDKHDLTLAADTAKSPDGFAQQGTKEGLAVPLSGNAGHMVVLRSKGKLLDWRDSRSWGLFGLILILGTIVAYMLARRLVNPLEELAKSAPEFSDKPLPEHLTNRSDELGLLARSLDDARQKILTEQEKRKQSERLAMLGQITTGLAHEIKNPAAAILMQADAMQNKEAATMIREEAEDIITLVNQWMFIAKPLPPKMVKHDLSLAIRSFIERRQDVYAYHGVQIHLDAPESLHAECDEKRIIQAARNLIDNGVAAMPEGGELHITLRQNGRFAEMTVRDSGKGFSPAALEHFGEPFYSEKEGGMGLGLALVKGVSEAHGGGAAASNNEDKGSTVTFWISTEHTIKKS